MQHRGSRRATSRAPACLARRFAWGLAIALSSCVRTEAPEPNSATSSAPRATAPEPIVVATEPTQSPVAPSGATTTPEPRPATLLITDREALRWLERRGLDFATNALELEPTPSERSELPSNAELVKGTAYAQVIRVLARDLAEFRAADPALGVGMHHSHRAFDPSWLSSPDFRFELVAIVNRIDRRVFTPNTCGEIRFVYRAHYSVSVSGQAIESRVPMTLNVVRWLPAGSEACRDEARRWQLEGAELKGTQLRGEALGAALLDAGAPLEQLYTRTRFKSLELNLQSARWPSTVRPNLAGHAEYLMRVFQRDERGAFVAATLENTPDVARLSNRPELRRDLVRWLSQPEQLDALDLGTLSIPERFLTTRATSVAPHGLARAGNRPFPQIVSERELADLDLSRYTTFSNPEQLLRRLDGLSCTGCHQTRSVAGFHLLGEDAANRRADALAVPHSPHVEDELARRQHYTAQLSAGEPTTELRLPTERMGMGDYGAHCGLDPMGPYASWACDAGLVCTRIDDPLVGQCQPEGGKTGDACETGLVRRNTNPHRDAASLGRPSTCSSGVCQRNAVGFPGGMCSGSCSTLDDTAICGGIAQLVAFNSCLARRQPFENCILEHTTPGSLRRCSARSPCREDYVCARLPNGEGGCIPPYFLFQLRVDGHVLK